MATLRRSIVVSTLFTLFGGPGFVLVYLPLAITRFRLPAGEPRWQVLLAAALILAGLVPLLDSIRRFVFVGRGTLMPNVPTERLVVSGLYRFARNPMYVGDLVALAGETILFRSPGLALYTVLVWITLHQFILRYEEPTLHRRHPQDYPRYQHNVPRWLPRLTPWMEDGN